MQFPCAPRRAGRCARDHREMTAQAIGPDKSSGSDPVAKSEDSLRELLDCRLNLKQSIYGSAAYTFLTNSDFRFIAPMPSILQDVVSVARVGQADILHLGAALDDRGRALDLQVLDHDDAVAIGKHVAVGIVHTWFVRGLRGCGRRGAPFMGAFRTYPEIAILISMFGIAFRTFHSVVHINLSSLSA